MLLVCFLLRLLLVNADRRVLACIVASVVPTNYHANCVRLRSCCAEVYSPIVGRSSGSFVRCTRRNRNSSNRRAGRPIYEGDVRKCYVACIWVVRGIAWSHRCDVLDCPLQRNRGSACSRIGWISGLP